MDNPAAHRCLVVIHGLGQEPRGQTLIDVGDPLIEFLALGEPGLVVLRSDVSPSAVGLATAQCRLPGGSLHIREAWWAGRFVAPAFAPILMWTVAVWSTQARSVVFGLWHSLWRDKEGTTADLQRERRFDCTESEVYSSPAPTLLSRIYDVIVGVALLAVLTLGVPLVLALVLVAWALQGIGAMFGVAAPIVAANQLMEQVYLRYLGEVYVYFSSGLLRTSIRGAIDDAVGPLLDPEHVKECAGLTIVAHSWGAIIALDSLLTLALRPNIQRRGLTLITVGSALNRVWWLRKRTSSQSRTPTTTERAVDAFWTDLNRGSLVQWLPHIRWVNFWSRYDPVAAGPMEPDLVASLPSVKIIERRVSNFDDLLSDHTSYWSNPAEVVSRLAYEVLGHPSPPPQVVCAALLAIPARRRAVGRLSIIRLLSIGLAAAVALAYVSETFAVSPATALAAFSRNTGATLTTAYLALLANVVARAFTHHTWIVGFWTVLVATVGALLLGLVSPEGDAVALRVPWLIAIRDAWLALTPLVHLLIDMVMLMGSYKLVRYFWLGPALDGLRLRQAGHR